MNNIDIYRAMCDTEGNDTKDRPSFLRRYKWFSLDREWITSRVMGGLFNNSNFKTDRYTRLYRFQIPESDLRWFDGFDAGNKELKLDRRNANQIRWMGVERIL